MADLENTDTGSGPLGDGVPCSWCNKLSCDGYCDGAVRDLKAQSYKTEGLLKVQDELIETLQKRVADLEADRNEAAKNVTCKRIVEQLEAAGMHEEASWARWIVWWREIDNQRSERFAKELRRVRCKSANGAGIELRS